MVPRLVLFAGVLSGLTRCSEPEPTPDSTSSGVQQPVQAHPLDFERHLEELRSTLLPEGFAVVVEPPFVVLGDLPVAEIEEWAGGTIRWAVHLLRQDYFDLDLTEIVDIWLFKDNASYRKHTWELFGERPSTHFGYYSPQHSALLMNISTGGGTLVHEIVHPYVATNFPACPTWLNEGLGSLYEACHSENGRIVGLVNWRLAGLRKCIDQERLPPFHWLFETTDEEFYGASRGDPYAQARYLCMWLEQHDLLRPFWRRLLQTHPEDPTGEATLLEVLQREDLDAFQSEWQEWVFTLTN